MKDIKFPYNYHSLRHYFTSYLLLMGVPIKDVSEMNPGFKEIIEKSFSCYFPKDSKACGECGSCLMRQNAFGRVSDGK